MARVRSRAAASLWSRVVAAILGGFVAASAAIIAIPAVLPGSKFALVTGASMLGFALWTGAGIWAFAARTASRAWLGLAALTTLFAGIAWLADPAFV